MEENRLTLWRFHAILFPRGEAMKENISSYTNWLSDEKGIGNKSAHDYASRLKRASQLLGESDIDSTTLEKLAMIEDFSSLSISVKSQIRRAVRLYCEYIENKS